MSFEGLTYTEKLDKIYKFMGGEESAFTNCTSTVSAKDSEGFIHISGVINVEGDAYFYSDFGDEYNIMYKSSDSGNSYAYEDNAHYYYYTKGGNFNIYLNDLNGKLTQSIVSDAIMNGKCGFKCLAVNNVKALHETAVANKVNYTINKSTITTDKFNAESGSYLYLNYVAIKGYNVYVNGKKAELINNGLDFLLVKLDEGENVVTFKYVSPYYKYIAECILIAAVLIFLIWFIYKKKPKIFKKCETVVSIAGYALAIALVGFFLIFPLGIYIKKLIAGLFNKNII